MTMTDGTMTIEGYRMTPKKARKLARAAALEEASPKVHEILMDIEARAINGYRSVDYDYYEGWKEDLDTLEKLGWKVSGVSFIKVSW